jgi:hypothetical protein
MPLVQRELEPRYSGNVGREQQPEDWFAQRCRRTARERFSNQSISHIWMGTPQKFSTQTGGVVRQSRCDDFWGEVMSLQAITSNVLETQFAFHANRWHRDTRHTSSLTRMITHPSYLRIIGLGPDAVPLLLRELSQRPDHWLVALNAITGEDPADENATFSEALEAWLEWGRRRGYLA